jgi:hypothetical protein
MGVVATGRDSAVQELALSELLGQLAESKRLVEYAEKFLAIALAVLRFGFD